MSNPGQVTPDEDKKYDVGDEVQRLEHAAPSGVKTLEERQAQLKAALEVDPGITTWSAAAFYMYFIAFVAFCCSGDSGFDGTVMGGVNGMAQYTSYFGINPKGDAKTSIVFGIFTVGSLCATFPAAYFPDRFGRRFSMFFGNFVLLIGGIITGTAKTKAVFIGGRLLTGFGSGCAGASAKSFLGELAPPQSRGMYVGFLNSFYYIGQMTATGMMVATGKWKHSELSWRLPLFVQCVPAGLNVLLVFFCPETPRWLYANGRPDEARRVLAKLHSSTGDLHSPLIDLEIEEIEERVQIDGADKRFWDFRPLFRSSKDRYRTYIVMMVGSFGQLSGNGMITYFLPVLLTNAGIVDQNKKLTLNFVNSVTSFAGALFGSWTVDRLGRRRQLLIGTAICATLLFTITGLLSGKTYSEVRSNAGISLIYLFMVVFSFGWTAIQALYPMEILPFEVRAKGLAFLNVCTQGASCINTFGLPVALSKLGWKVYLIFALWDVFETVMIWCFLPETKSLSLEQIQDVFAADHPVKYSVERRAAMSSGSA